MYDKIFSANNVVLPNSMFFMKDTSGSPFKKCSYLEVDRVKFCIMINNWLQKILCSKFHT